MKVRVINFEEFADYCDNNNLDVSIHELTDEQFMEIYNKSNTWEFDSLEGFACEFNADGAYAPTPNGQIIRFFPNE